MKFSSAVSLMCHVLLVRKSEAWCKLHPMSKVVSHMIPIVCNHESVL